MSRTCDKMSFHSHFALIAIAISILINLPLKWPCNECLIEFVPPSKSRICRGRLKLLLWTASHWAVYHSSSLACSADVRAKVKRKERPRQYFVESKAGFSLWHHEFDHGMFWNFKPYNHIDLMRIYWPQRSQFAGRKDGIKPRQWSGLLATFGLLAL